jgi:hypothetical protein
MLSLFVVFDHPRDFPLHVVVREQCVTRTGQIAHRAVACLYTTLSEAMQEYRERGLHWLPREPDDDPVILGTWL